jgi:hypothetical protein
LHEVYLSGDFTHYGQAYVDEGFAKLVVSNYSLDSCLNVNVNYSSFNVGSVLMPGVKSFGRDTILISIYDFNPGVNGYFNVSFEISNVANDYSPIDNISNVNYSVTQDQQTGRFYDSLQISKGLFDMSYGDTVVEVGVIYEGEMADAMLFAGVCHLDIEVPDTSGIESDFLYAVIYYWDSISEGWVSFSGTDDFQIDNLVPGSIESIPLYVPIFSGDIPISEKYMVSIGNYWTYDYFLNVGRRAKAGSVYYKNYQNVWYEAENARYPEFSVTIWAWCGGSVGENDINLAIAPNPSSGVFNYELESSIIGQLQVLDLNGRIVFEQNISSSMSSIDLSHLDNAVYLLQLIDSGVVVATEKLVLQK